MPIPIPTPSRRTILLGGVAAAGLAALGGTPASAAPGKLTDPFTLGVASGDPHHDSVVLWTRLAQDPFAENGLGGMPGRPIPVQWEIATDERFRHVVRRGEVLARPESAHSVHVEVDWLRPGTEYFYRFRTQNHLSPAGRTRTAPEPWALRTALTMCFASCSHFGAGYFTAYRRLAEDHPDLILHLGDYQYEYAAGANDVRTVLGPETRALADYRLRHAQYKTDADLQLAHATAPWAVIWDDHETENNWADEVPEQPDPAFLDRRKAAFQAYYENMPLRRTARPHGIDMQLYRRLQWGGLVNFHRLDTRQFRDNQACGDGVKAGCDARLDPNRSITGPEQERWILDGFRRSRARWDVLTGDVHRHWAAEVKTDYTDPGSKGVGVEFVTTSITSGGDGNDDPNTAVLAENPHVKFHKNRRGYVRTKFTADELRADYRIVPYVRQPDAPASTAASFVVEDRKAALNPV